MDKALDEEFEQFLHENGKQLRLPPEINGAVMNAAVLFAARVRDEAVAARVNEIKETVYALNSHEQHTGLIEPCPICEACERIWKLYEQPSPDTRET